MHIDARNLENNSVIEGDICIIGAGAAGLSIALDWLNTSYKVILLDGALIINASKIIQNLNESYPVIEINGVGDFNRKMILVIKQVGGEICKVHTTYRYIFDRTKPFKRMDFI